MIGYGPPHQQLHTDSQMQTQNPHFEGPESLATLLVRNLPEGISQEALSGFFSYYGASMVRPCAGGRLRNCAFVDFRSEALASQSQSQLNRLRYYGKVLLVERASQSSSNDKNEQYETPSVKGSSGLSVSLTEDAPLIGNLTQGTNPGSLPVGEPIASRLGVDYPFPPHLEYAYPPPDGNILTNIVNALIAVPPFYTQVLHLMNKMNIPAPFRMALPTPPLPVSAPAPPPPPPPPIVAKPHLADLSSDESELESSEEGDDDGWKVTKHGQKRARREAIVGPAVDKDVAHEAVGLRPSTLVPKEIPMIKKKNPVLQIKIAPKSIQNELKDDDSSMKESEQPTKDSLELKEFATPEEIERGKLPPEDIYSLPKFKKNRTDGDPANVLYIKNLAKDVVTDDFYFIFGSFFGTIEAAKSGLNVKLMQEGRMRGQAFVTFPSVDLAHRALKLVDGYVFKGKPMVIQFGRNPSAGKIN